MPKFSNQHFEEQKRGREGTICPRLAWNIKRRYHVTTPYDKAVPGFHNHRIHHHRRYDPGVAHPKEVKLTG
jgi:hypothetical protein